MLLIDGDVSLKKSSLVAVWLLVTYFEFVWEVGKENGCTVDGAIDGIVCSMVVSGLVNVD